MRANDQRNALQEAQRSLGNRAVQRLVETSIQRHPEGTQHQPGAAKFQEASWDILPSHKPTSGETLVQYVDRLLAAHTVTDTPGGKSERDFLLQQAPQYWGQYFNAVALEKKKAAETSRIDAKEKEAAARVSSRDKQQQEKAATEKKKQQQQQLAQQMPSKRAAVKEKVEAEQAASARNQQLELIRNLTRAKDRPWTNKGIAMVPRQGMSTTGQNHVLTVLDTIMQKLGPKIDEIGRTAGSWRTKDEFVKLTLQETPGSLGSHIRLDLESMASIEGVGFYGKIRIQGNGGQTWGGLFFQFNKAKLDATDFRRAIQLSLEAVGSYACIYDAADNPPLPGSA